MTTIDTTEQDIEDNDHMLNNRVVVASNVKIDKAPGERYDTPPSSFSEAVSPISSRSRGILRAGSLGISPSAGRSTRKAPPPVLAMDSHQRLPSLDDTNLRTLMHVVNSEQNVREPLPKLQYPPIEQVLQRDDQETGVLSHSYGLIGPPQQQALPLSKDHATNPYADRADEIGPTHGILGVGHLGDLLPPPGWIEGTEPADLTTVKLLYDASRKEAKDILNKELAEAAGLAAEEQMERKSVRDCKWIAQLKLDKLLKAERTAIHEISRQHQSFGSKRDELKSPAFLPIHVNTTHSLGPQYNTAIPHITDVFRRESATLFSEKAEQERRTYLSGQGNKLSDVNRVGFACPAALDPSLATDSFQAVSDRYHIRKEEIKQQYYKNEQMYIFFLHKYGYHFSTGPVSPGAPSPPMVKREYGGSLTRPLPFVSPTRRKFSVADLSDRQSDAPSFNAGAVVPSTPDWLQCSQRIGLPPNQPEYHKMRNTGSFEKFPEPMMRTASPVTLTGFQEVPPDVMASGKKKRAPRKKVEKVQPWYHKHLVHADLPTSEISEDAIRAGIEYGITGISAKKAATQAAGLSEVARVEDESSSPHKTPKKRRRKQTMNAEAKVEISTDSLEKLYAANKDNNIFPGLAEAIAKSRQIRNSIPNAPNTNAPEVVNAGHTSDPVNFVYSTRATANATVPTTSSTPSQSIADDTRENRAMADKVLLQEWSALNPPGQAIGRKMSIGVHKGFHGEFQLSPLRSGDENNQDDVAGLAPGGAILGKTLNLRSSKRKSLVPTSDKKRTRVKLDMPEVDGVVDLRSSPLPQACARPKANR